MTLVSDIASRAESYCGAMDVPPIKTEPGTHKEDREEIHHLKTYVVPIVKVECTEGEQILIFSKRMPYNV